MRKLSSQFVYLRLAVVIVVTGVSCGCRLPASTVGLDSVLQAKIHKNRDDVVRYRCTAGAHRGASVQYTENSIDALRSAMTNDAFAFIEFDVQFSADNKIVVFHDKNLKRIYGVGDKIGSRSFAELSELSGGTIATYNEAMSTVEGKKLNIEIKSQGDKDEDERLADYVVADIEARKIDDDVVVSSISDDVIKYISGRYPKIATGQIFWIKSSTYLPFDSFTKKLYDDITETDADYLMLYVANLHNINDLLALKPKGKVIMFWDFDDSMYLVHKDLSDRLWGDSWLKTMRDYFRYKLRRRGKQEG